MTSLINIPSDMRKRINERLYTTQLCLEHLGKSNPGPADIRNWKESWSTEYSVSISSVSKAQTLLKEQEVPPLLYDIRANRYDNDDDWAGSDMHADWWQDTYGNSPRFVVFFREEDYVIFKLLHNNS